MNSAHLFLLGCMLVAIPLCVNIYFQIHAQKKPDVEPTPEPTPDVPYPVEVGTGYGRPSITQLQLGLLHEQIEDEKITLQKSLDKKKKPTEGAAYFPPHRTVYDDGGSVLTQIANAHILSQALSDSPSHSSSESSRSSCHSSHSYGDSGSSYSSSDSGSSSGGCD